MAITGGLITHFKPKMVSLSAVITRADGSVENRGMIAFYHRNPLLRFAVNVWIPIKRFLKRET